MPQSAVAGHSLAHRVLAQAALAQDRACENRTGSRSLGTRTVRDVADASFVRKHWPTATSWTAR
eukprot:15465884-Alexandrium_andersonii.AAC.1